MNFCDIDTPAVVVDFERARLNIRKFQSYCDSIGLKLRPHVKTHKIPMFAKMQIEEGAIGVTCQKISEAESIISDGGINDLLITYNIIGEKKLNRLLALSKKVKLSVVADNIQCIEGLSKAFMHSKDSLSVLVECDTGAMRCGVVDPKKALLLAKTIIRLPGINFGGLMTYPPELATVRVNDFLLETKNLLERNKISVPDISVGGTPDMWNAHNLSVATEYRIGTYIYNDRSLLEKKVCAEKDCALTILATVVSTPTKNRAVIDAGSKVLTSDLSKLNGHGYIVGYPTLLINKLSEEHGCITSEVPTDLQVGQRLHIIPNHACVVTNMVDHIILKKTQEKYVKHRVKARGKVW